MPPLEVGHSPVPPIPAHQARSEKRLQQSQEKGLVRIASTVSQDGAVLAMQIVRSSGSVVLDQAVHDMLAGKQVPAFPAAITEAQTQVAISIRFPLDR